MSKFSELSLSVDEVFERKCASDSKLNNILKKIESGSADMRDTAEFSKRLGHLARQSVFEVYRDELGTRPQWSDVQATVDMVLHDNYETINKLNAKVQKDLDRKAGINLSPIKPNYPTERVKKVIGAAANAKDNEQAVRRMGSPVENITVSFHDDYIRENADFRTKAGIECYVERITDGTCCQWCTDIAGKYLMREQPEGFWGKHDNCSCMIIYDGKVLRGQLGANGRRGRRWVEEPPKVEYTPPKRFSHDEAEKLQAELLPRRLTNGLESDRIYSDGNGEPILITDEAIASVPKLNVFSDETNERIQKESRHILETAKDLPLNSEVGYSLPLDLSNGKKKIGEPGEGTVAIPKLDVPYISIHNHPSGESFSVKDLDFFANDKHCKAIVVVGNNGKLFTMKKDDNVDNTGFFEYIMRRQFGFLPDLSEKEFLKGAEKYGYKYYE